MKKIVVLLTILVVTSSFLFQKKTNSAVHWVSWERAMELNKQSPKKIFVDVYTDWCGWCKKMDATTFSDEKVASFMNENFYCVKFDAEQKEDVIIQNDTLHFNPNNGRRGTHDLAVALLDGNMGYPSYVYLDEKMKRITISPGYKEVDPFLDELSFISKEIYNKMSYQEYIDAKNK